ncbi:uncharacterized protein BO97DRAFT_430184 [Aspergillus homomorphus CBS 101889]|uniref:Uncharacterized protein n=1 Tax=Aspergillus homomorphus (strain CBS 101889) TaxID=1450537 RepID=A0A395HFG3_ASPHC|nr:hypothetical protein BO97DRAFT_430184 [Aspergillus homomorphus CBS 101889]RAL06470.1 hypothetical protein BO97DRAFT_430184 [Aspergillus homomorphus CBS 101889]
MDDANFTGETVHAGATPGSASAETTSHIESMDDDLSLPVPSEVYDPLDSSELNDIQVGVRLLGHYHDDTDRRSFMSELHFQGVPVFMPNHGSIVRDYASPAGFWSHMVERKMIAEALGYGDGTWKRMAVSFCYAVPSQQCMTVPMTGRDGEANAVIPL